MTGVQQRHPVGSMTAEEIMLSRPMITVAGAKVIGREPVGNIKVVVIDLPWRPDERDKRE